MSNPPIRLQALLDVPPTAQVDSNFAKQGATGSRAFTRGFNSQIKGLTDQARQELERLQRIAKRAFQTFGGSLDRGMRRVENAGFNALFGRLPPGIYQSHQFNASVQRRLNQLAQQQNLPGAAGGGFGRMPPAPIMAARARGRSIVQTLGPLPRAAITTASSMYIAERLLNFVLAPFKAMTREVIEATDKIHDFRVGLMSAAGSFERATVVERGISRAIRDLPIRGDDARAAALAYGTRPAFAAQLAMGSNEQAVSGAVDLIKTASRLRQMSPEQRTGAEQLTLNEILEGGGRIAYRSAIQRYGITPELLARLKRVDVKQLIADPQLGLSALSDYTKIFSNDSAMEEAKRGIGIQIEKLREMVSDSLVQLFDANGLYRKVSNRLTKTRESFSQYLDSQASTDRFSRMSNDVEILLSNLSDSLQGFITSITGKQEGGIAGLMGLAEHITERVAELSAALPDLGTSLGELVKTVGLLVDDIASEVGRVGSMMQNGPRGIIGSWLEDKQNRLHGQLAYERSLQLMSTQLAKWDSELAFGTERRTDMSVYGERFVSVPNVGNDGRISLLRQQAIDALDRLPRDSTEAIPSELYSARKVREWVLKEIPDFEARLERAKRDMGISRQFIGEAIKPSIAPADLLKLIGEETTPNYRAISAFATSKIAASDSARSSLRDLSDRRYAIVHGNYGTADNPLDLAGIRKRMSEMNRDYSDRALRAIASGQLVFGATGDSETARHVEAAKNMLTRSQEQYRISSQSITDALNQAVREYGFDLQRELGDDIPASVRAELLRRISDGTTGLAEDIRAAMLAAGESVSDLRFSIESLSPEDQVSLMRRRVAAAAESGFEIGDLGELNLGQNSDAVKQAWRNRNQSNQFAAAESLRRLKKLEPEQSALVDRNLAAFNADQSEANLVALAQSQADLSKLLSTMRQLRIESDLTLAGMLEFSAQVRDSLSSNLADGLADVVMGVGDLSDAFKNLASDIVRSFMRIQVQNLMFGLLGDFGNRNRDGSVNTGLGGLAGMFANFFSGSMNTRNAASNSHVNTGFTVRPAARGEVFMGGLHVPSFAQGGVVRKPTFALIGDAAGNPTRGSEEVVLPLVRAQGRLGVAAHGIGGGQPIVNVTVVDNHREAAAHIAQQQMRTPTARNIIIDTWADSYMSGNKAFKVTRAKK